MVISRNMRDVTHGALRATAGDRVKRFCCILFLVVAGVSASALEVQQVLWGFDGQVVPGRFNLFSVLLANPSADPFDGPVKLYKNRGLAERVGGVYQTACYLSPQSTRWLQFYVYVDALQDGWHLEWDRGSGGSLDIQAPKWGPPAQVLLSDALSASSAFRQFPEELFPPTETATGGLDSLLLDHTPHWEPAKRQAFLDWLKAGGKVHLLMGADGRYPVFSDELGVLNTSVGSTRAGAGLIVRHAATAHDIRKQDLQDAELPWRQFKPGELPSPTQTADLFFNALARFSQRQYGWAGICLLAILYAALVGPVNLRLARRLADYRQRIALLLATIAGFTFLFYLAGRRGQGERSVVHSLSYARAIDGRAYDVLQWVNVFVAQGSRHTITHAAPHNLYATGKDYEAVNGVIESGKDGRFVVDLPMFSQRAFLHEAKMEGPDIPLEILKWNGAEALEQLVVSVGPDFSRQVLEGWAVEGDQIYPMQLWNETLVFGNSNHQPVEEFMSAAALLQFEVVNGQLREQEVANDERRFRKLAGPLVAWSLGTVDFTRWRESPRTAHGRIQLFLFARSPAGFGISSAGLGTETGYVLYHFNLFRPESAQ